MRSEYQKIEEVGGLSIDNSSINLLQEMKSLQSQNTDVINLTKEDIRNDIAQTL